MQADDSTAGGGGGGKKRAEKLKASPLSIDQTPFRKDERERCKRAGAVIATMDQLEGEEDMHERREQRQRLTGDTPKEVRVTCQLQRTRTMQRVSYGVYMGL